MSVVGIDTGFELGAAPSVSDEISRRLEAMPGTAYVWRLVILLSLGGCFEIYDLFLTGYIAPGLSRTASAAARSSPTRCSATPRRP